MSDKQRTDINGPGSSHQFRKFIFHSFSIDFKMAGLTPDSIAELKEKFSDLIILTPGTRDYEENML